jgi:hypothetical protein
MNRLFYAAHRWLSAAALAQLVIWAGSGLFFAAFPIESVHGEHAEINRNLDADDAAGLVSPAMTISLATSEGFALEALELRRRPEGPVWIARGPHHQTLRFDARSGALAPVDRAEAEAVARADQRETSAVLDAVYVERDPPIEYRDKPLPAWRVQLADTRGTIVWVDAHTADVTARRNDLWRWYDFLWSLHIMDYRGRESFHHPLIIIAAVLALLAVSSGAALWFLRLARRFRRPSRAARSTSVQIDSGKSE